METNTEVPEYRTTAPAFFAPNLVPAGSVVRFRGPPGPHLEPLNEAAYRALEEWYAYEEDEVDPKTRQKTGNRVRPHEKYRLAKYVPSEQHTAEVMSLPRPDEAPSLSLAETMAGANRVSTDQRPGPAGPKKPVWSPPMEASAEASADAPEAPSVEIAEVAAPGKYIPRRN